MKPLQEPICPSRFFACWKAVCDAKKQDLLAAWTSCPALTAQIFNVEDAIVVRLASELKLKSYCGYYSLDAIFFRDEDRVHCAPTGQTWVQNVRIAFEHENIFRSGLFTETSHLLITRADLRVLISYPDDQAQLEVELDNLSRVISQSDPAATDPAFLFIVGNRISDSTDIQWSAYTYQGHKLLPMAQ